MTFALTAKRSQPVGIISAESLSTATRRLALIAAAVVFSVSAVMAYSLLGQACGSVIVYAFNLHLNPALVLGAAASVALLNLAVALGNIKSTPRAFINLCAGSFLISSILAGC